jgi:hypothetical protein
MFAQITVMPLRGLITTNTKAFGAIGSFAVLLGSRVGMEAVRDAAATEIEVETAWAYRAPTSVLSERKLTVIAFWPFARGGYLAFRDGNSTQENRLATSRQRGSSVSPADKSLFGHQRP